MKQEIKNLLHYAQACRAAVKNGQLDEPFPDFEAMDKIVGLLIQVEDTFREGMVSARDRDQQTRPTLEDAQNWNDLRFYPREQSDFRRAVADRCRITEDRADRVFLELLEEYDNLDF